MENTLPTKPVSFSALHRAAYWQRLREEEFDVLVIGGGITGAGIALDAATRGLRVALVEKRDFASGTSSRSTKLIHGGLRYLKQLEIRLVREVGLERAIVHRNARHLVLAERMLLPIVEGGSLGKMMSSLGLWVYDYLAKVDKKERRRMMPADETLSVEPLLRKDIVKGGGLYYEYRTDDARLTIETIKTAVANGGLCLNYAAVEGFDFADEAQPVAIVRDALQPDAAPVRLRAKYIINAAGPWVDTLRAVDTEGVRGKRLHLTKGVHIVVPRERLPLQQSAYFDVLADKRMCFAIPRQGVTYIGTTDTNYKESTDNPQADSADVDYILAAANEMFPTAKLSRKDVISTWAGLRPLIHQEGKSPSELSRKDEIFVSSSGLISIAGGKLTGYRKMAERVVDLVCKKMGKSIACRTANLRVNGADFDNRRAFDEFVQKRSTSMRDLGVHPSELIALAQRYGSNLDLIIERAYELAPQLAGDGAQALEYAELLYGVDYEMVTTMEDFLIRRTGWLYFERPRLEKSAERIFKWLQNALSQSPETAQAQHAAYLQEYASVMQWSEK